VKTAIYRKVPPKPFRVQEPFFKAITENAHNSQATLPFFEKAIKSHSPQSLIQTKASTNPAPKDAPAWSKEGSIFLAGGFFAASPDKQTEILQHESVHALHQRYAPTDNSDAARNRAENLANNPALANAHTLAVPAPAVLGFPPQSYDNWNQVFLGVDHIIGEIIVSGIILRIAIPYDEIGIKELTQKGTLGGIDMDLIVKDKSAVYHCGPHPFKPIATYIERLKKVAAVADKVNSKIPAGSMWKAELVVMGPGVNEAFRIANGKGVLELDSKNINTNFILDSAAHEASHGVFEHHAAAGDPDYTKRVPDNFALAIADVFAQLSNTKNVDLPTGKFDPKIKPTAPTGNGAPAGLVMVVDTLWSGSGGHPWDGVDEFFASSYGAYTQDKSLLNKIIDHYISFDSSIKPIKPTLLGLLKIAGDQKKISALKAPANSTAANAALGSLGAVPDHTNIGSGLGIIAELIDPSKVIGPATIKC
jgi:hypothetical protein